MNMNPRTLVLHSGRYGVFLALLGGAFGGIEFAIGILVTSGVMMLNIWGWSKVVGNAIGTTIAGKRPFLALGLYAAKCGLLGGSIWFLLGQFSALAVVLGSSVVLIAVSTWGLRMMIRDHAIGELG